MEKCQGDLCDHGKCTEQQRLEREVERLRQQLEAERESLRLATDRGMSAW